MVTMAEILCLRGVYFGANEIMNAQNDEIVYVM